MIGSETSRTRSGYVTVGLVAVLVSGAAAARADTKKLNVYMVKAKGAVSILDDKDYQRVLKDGVFKDHNLTIDTSGGKEAFLKKLLASDLTYMSVHANPDTLEVGNGDHVHLSDLARAYRENDRKGPRLVIVTGCTTIRKPGKKVNLAAAIGFKPDSEKKAYLGFKTITPGLYADRYFRVFLATWLRPKPGGGYRTLEESRTEAKQFIQRMLPRRGPHLGKVAGFAPLDALVAGWFTIIGDSGLKVTDL